jgi:hypothetical protein
VHAQECGSNSDTCCLGFFFLCSLPQNRITVPVPLSPIPQTLQSFHLQLHNLIFDYFKAQKECSIKYIQNYDKFVFSAQVARTLKYSINCISTYSKDHLAHNPVQTYRLGMLLCHKLHRSSPLHIQQLDECMKIHHRLGWLVSDNIQIYCDSSNEFHIYELIS